MKIVIAITLSSCIGLAAIAQEPQLTPIQPGVVGGQATVSQATAGSPIVLNLSGVTVTDRSGQPLGPIQHILLSPAGCVDMAVVSLGGSKLVPVPWQLVSGSGAARADTELAGQAAFVLGVDRSLLMVAPSVPAGQVAQLGQGQTLQQVHTFYSKYQQPDTAVGGTASQPGINVGVSASASATNSVNLTNQVGGTFTNRLGGTSTNQLSGALTNRLNVTNRTGILSPTGPTNAIPGRPAFETNRPGQPNLTPPANRPPTNRPPTATPVIPRPSGTPAQPAQPGTQ